MTYADAILAHNAAQAVYLPIRNAYRAGTVTDAAFLAAKAVYDAATKAFDAAFEAAANEPTEAEAEATDDAQLTLAF